MKPNGEGTLKNYSIVFLILFAILLGQEALAKTAYGAPSPVGYWRAYDDSGTFRSIVQMTIVNNTLQGKISKVIAPKCGSALDAYCSKCSDQFHNKPLKNLVFIWGLKKKGEKWENGHILDTDTGRIYRCQVSVSNDNKTLYVLGYVGAPLLGKKIKWIRVQ